MLQGEDSSNANPPDGGKLQRPFQSSIKTVVMRGDHNIEDEEDEERLLLPRAGDDEELKVIKPYT